MNYGRISTTPGDRSPLAPPAEWNGSDQDYRALMRHRYEATAFITEAALASYRYPVTVTGPFAKTGAEILLKIRERAGLRGQPYEIQGDKAA